MRWKKRGIIYRPDGSLTWAVSHAMIPTPHSLTEEVIRLYLTFRDVRGIGRPGFIDVLASDPTQVINVSKEPLLDVGARGAFDENGILACSYVNVTDRVVYMYYAGFELSQNVRYRLMTGLAISEDGGQKFRRYSQKPILNKIQTEQCIRGGPFCRLQDGVFRLWYCGGSSWRRVRGKLLPDYEIKYLESSDGIHWDGVGKTVLAPQKPCEHAFGRPYITQNSDREYQMYYSIRREDLGEYRLGYAESSDAIDWTRMDEKLGLHNTDLSFDSDAIMYAAPFSHGNTNYIFYNGNDFGRDGVAFAELLKR